MDKVSIFWFRRDLRLFDNTGLYHALSKDTPVLPIFIFDTNILDKLPSKQDRRVQFIYEALKEIKSQVPSLRIFHGKPLEVWKKIVEEFKIEAVYTNHDYEPYARERDALIEDFLRTQNIPFYTYKDQVIFEKDELLKPDGTPYTVYTPYMKKWRSTLKMEQLNSYPSEKLVYNFCRQPAPFPKLQDIGFVPDTNFEFPKKEISPRIIQEYKQKRDFPGIVGTSRLSVHIRFGTRSVRELIRKAFNMSETWVNEMIWREFYMMILWHFPHVVDKAFKPEYDNIVWENNSEHFELWCQGKTGYPLVDAGMRELNATGYMHNRVRMVTASFLVKDLLIDWRWGERYFAEKLLDFELASNNGGWQWVAGSGCDGSPYFRVFNPILQQQKFDPDFVYIKKWLPEYGTLDYPKPIIDHEFAKNRAIQRYSQALPVKEKKEKKLAQEDSF
ncbi:MAG: DNA photolyase family protein [Bacteroidia bacterium]|nr:DNA photolyase family protein [Bacteroidia bacterium]MDW8302595.1 deoxyribodipyrimidine photo-lyase [Bacteroidia bacterium]